MGYPEAITREETNLETLKAEGVKFKKNGCNAIHEVSNVVHENFAAQSDIIKSFIETAKK